MAPSPAAIARASRGWARGYPLAPRYRPPALAAAVALGGPHAPRRGVGAGPGRRHGHRRRGARLLEPVPEPRDPHRRRRAVDLGPRRRPRPAGARRLGRAEHVRRRRAGRRRGGRRGRGRSRTRAAGRRPGDQPRRCVVAARGGRRQPVGRGGRGLGTGLARPHQPGRRSPRPLDPHAAAAVPSSSPCRGTRVDPAAGEPGTCGARAAAIAPGFVVIAHDPRRGGLRSRARRGAVRVGGRAEGPVVGVRAEATGARC